MKSSIEVSRVLKISLSLWIGYLILYLATMKFNLHLLSGALSFIGEAGLDIAAIIILSKIIRLSNEEDKLTYKLFLYSFISALIADGFYTAFLNIFQIDITNYFIDSIFDIPFGLFLLFQLLAWFRILLQTKNKTDNNFIFLPYILFAIIIFFFFTFGFTWKIKQLSLIGFYQNLDTILEVVGFSLASICLLRANSKSLQLVSAGYLIVVSSDLFIRSDIVNGLIPFLSIMEASWVMGLLLMVIGFFLEKKAQII